MKALIIFAISVFAIAGNTGTSQAQSKSPLVKDSSVAEILKSGSEHKEKIVPIGTIVTNGKITKGTVTENSAMMPSPAPMPYETLETMADSLTPEAARKATVDGMDRVIAKIVKTRVPGSTDLLRSGQTIDLTTMIDTERTVAAWHTVNLKASFDARPIGGILDIKVGLAPVFGGVGSAVRSVVYREFDQAIDNFDDEFVAQTISRLTKELGDEYASK